MMMNLKERYPALTGDDVFYCVLSLFVVKNCYDGVDGCHV